jgi:hypothetical protein
MKLLSRLIFTVSLGLAVTSVVGARGEQPIWQSAPARAPVVSAEPDFEGDEPVAGDQPAISRFFKSAGNGLHKKKEAILSEDYSKKTDRKITKLALLADCKMLCGSPYLFYRIKFPDYDDGDSSFPELGGVEYMPWIVPGQTKMSAPEEDSQLPMPRRVPDAKPQPLEPGGVSIYQPVRESNR